MARTWKSSRGRVLVVEDAETASLVIVGRELNDAKEKISAIEEVLDRLRATAR